jgi:hypothetical protein
MHGAEIQALQRMPSLSFKAAYCDGHFASLHWHQCNKKNILNDALIDNSGRSMGINLSPMMANALSAPRSQMQ